MDKSKSLQQLEAFDMGDPEGAPTNMVRRCLTLHRTPLEQWSAEDCRLMLGQGFSPQILVPLALEFLYVNSMEAGTMYDGALLDSVLRLPANFWADEPELWWQVNEIVTEIEFLKEAIEDLAPRIENFKTLEAK